MPADIRLVRYNGEYGPNLPGFLTVPNPSPLQHNFHVRLEQKSQVLPNWDFEDRAQYRLLELPTSLVNIGNQPMELGNVFVQPQWYEMISNGSRWMVIINGLFTYKLDAGPVKPAPGIFNWDMIPAIPGIPKVPSAFMDVKLSPGWGANVVEPMFHPLDITDVPDGEHMLSIMVTPPGSSPHVLDFVINLNVTDITVGA